MDFSQWREYYTIKFRNREEILPETHVLFFVIFPSEAFPYKAGNLRKEARYRRDSGLGVHTLAQDYKVIDRGNVGFRRYESH